MTSPADLDALQRVIRESGVDRTLPGPSWSGYAGALLEAFFVWLERVRPDRGLRELPGVLGPAVAVVAAGLLAVILVTVVRSILRRHGTRPRRGPAATHAVAAPMGAVPELGRDGWRSEIERRLAAGDFAGALEASWWWFARAITNAPVDAAWTSRELLAHAHRLELGGLALALDRLLYGAARPRGEDIRAFLRRAEETLP